MQPPEGEATTDDRGYPEGVPERRLVWTDALLPGYRPAPDPFMTAILLLAPAGQDTCSAQRPAVRGATW